MTKTKVFLQSCIPTICKKFKELLYHADSAENIKVILKNRNYTKDKLTCVKNNRTGKLLNKLKVIQLKICKKF